MREVFHELHWYLSIAREYPGFHERLDELRKEQSMTREQWVKLRDQRLQKMINFAVGKVPYYREIARVRGIVPLAGDIKEIVKLLPILDKTTVRGKRNELISDDVEKNDLLENATGGSTGSPLNFFQDKEYIKTFQATNIYMREWWGIHPHDKMAAVWGADREFHDLSWKERTYWWRYRIRAINAFRMQENTLLSFCKMLKSWRPPYIIGYSSALEALAKCAQLNNIKGISFRAIRSSAEMLWPHQRRLIEDTFQSPVYNTYGSREINCLAAECPEHRMHLMSTWRYIEITDEDGNTLPEGEAGSIVVTDLSNWGMPFIRYRNEDVGRISMERCPCGRPSPVLKDLLGRTTDLIRAPDGKMIHGEFFTHLFYGRSDIIKFQVHQTSIDRLIIRYVPGGHVSGEYLSEIKEKVLKQVGEGTEVEFVACDDIPLSSSGKYRFTLSDVKPADVRIPK